MLTVTSASEMLKIAAGPLTETGTVNPRDLAKARMWLLKGKLNPATGSLSMGRVTLRPETTEKMKRIVQQYDPETWQQVASKFPAQIEQTVDDVAGKGYPPAAAPAASIEAPDFTDPMWQGLTQGEPVSQTATPINQTEPPINQPMPDLQQGIQQLEQLYHQAWNTYMNNIVPNIREDAQRTNQLNQLFMQMQPTWASLRHSIAQNPEIANRVDPTHIQAATNAFNTALKTLETLQQSEDYNDNLLQGFQDNMTRAVDSLSRLTGGASQRAIANTRHNVLTASAASANKMFQI